MARDHRRRRTFTIALAALLVWSQSPFGSSVFGAAHAANSPAAAGAYVPPTVSAPQPPAHKAPPSNSAEGRALAKLEALPKPGKPQPHPFKVPNSATKAASAPQSGPSIDVKPPTVGVPSAAAQNPTSPSHSPGPPSAHGAAASGVSSRAHPAATLASVVYGATYGWGQWCTAPTSGP